MHPLSTPESLHFVPHNSNLSLGSLHWKHAYADSPFQVVCQLYNLMRYVPCSHASSIRFTQLQGFNQTPLTNLKRKQRAKAT